MVQRLSTFAADVRAIVLTGLSTATSTVVAATDSILTAIGKLQAQVSLKAPLASPGFSGIVSAPSLTTGTSTLSATTTLTTAAYGQTIVLSGSGYVVTLPIAATGASIYFLVATTSYVTLSYSSGLGGFGQGAISANVTGAQSYAWEAISDGTSWFVAPVSDASWLGAKSLFKNRLHNPLHEIQQRGTGPFTTNGGFASDRWVVGTSAASLSTNIISGTFGPARYYLQTSASLTSTQTMYHSQRLESSDVADLVGEFVTVSFWASASNSGGGVTAVIQLAYANTVDNWSGATIVGTTSVAISGTATRVSASFLVPSQGVNGLLAQIILTASAAGTCVLNSSAAQVEVGGMATAVERRPKQVEFALCQRYYQRGSLLSIGYCLVGNNYQTTALFPVQMRATPTMIVTNNSNSNLSGFGLLSTETQVYNVGMATATGAVGVNCGWSASADL